MAQFGAEPKKEFSWKKPLILIGSLLFIFIAYNILIDQNIAGYYKIIEPIGGGSYDAVMEPGRFFKGFNRVITWEKSATYAVDIDSSKNPPLDRRILARFSDAGTASLPVSVRYTIGPDKQKFIALHIRYRNENNFRDRVVKQLVTEAATLTSSLMTAEESYTTHRALFSEYAVDQLNHGVYLVDTFIDTTISADGEMKVIRRAVIKRGAGEKILRKEYSLKDFDVDFSQLVIPDFDYQASIKNQISVKLTNLVGIVTSKAESELKAAEKDTAKAYGEMRVVKAKYGQEVLNVAELIKTQMAADTARIVAETKKSVAALLAQAAELNKLRDIFIGEGEGEKQRLLQQADDNLTIQLEMWKEGHLATARIIKSSTDFIPEYLLPIPGSSAQTGMDLFNLKLMQDITGQKKE